MDVDAYRRLKGKGRKGTGKTRKGTGKRGFIGLTESPDTEDLAYYSKGKFRTKGRKGNYSRTWTLKGKAKGAPVPGKGKGRGLVRKGTVPYCTRCRRPGHYADHCYATTHGKGLRY